MSRLASPLVWFLLIVVAAPVVATIDRGTGAATDGKAPRRRAERGAKITALSYEVHLPADLAKKATYPLLVLIHNTGLGAQYMDQIVDALRDLDWIVVCTNDINVSQKGDVILRVLENTLADVEAKFPVDRDRRYVGGFSAGAMASYLVTLFRPGMFRGVVADGGVIHGGMANLRAVKRMKLREVVLMSGTADAQITTREMRGNRGLVRSSGAKVRLLTFGGAHEIAPARLYRTALQWLEGSVR